MIVLVISTGKAGSSAVAKILHNRLIISMGIEFKKPDEENPTGFWEDLEFKNLNELFLRGGITIIEFETRIKQLINKRNETYDDWGLKDPRLCYLWGIYLKFIPNAKIIIVERDNDKVVASCQKYYGWNYENTKRLVYDRTNQIRFLKKLNPLIINMNEKKTDNEIETIIKEGLYA